MLQPYVMGNPQPPGGVPAHFLAFQPASEPLAIITEAVDLVRERTAAPGVLASCDSTFRAIRGVSFSDLLYGGVQVTVFRFHSTTDFGLTPRPAGLARSIGISQRCWGLRDHGHAVRRSAATLVHELAHCAGAAGGSSTVAERTLRFCGFSDMDSPGLAG